MRGRIKLFFSFLILITAAIVVFLLGTLLGVFPIVRPYLAEGPVIALSLPVAGEDGLQALLSGQSDAEQAEKLLRPAVEQAAASGVNTLLLELADPESGRVIFEEEQRDSLLEGVDLLELLCRLGREYEIQVFALADPAVLTKKAATEKNSEMDSLTACCADLLRRYPIAGLVVRGEDRDAATAAAFAEKIGRLRGGRSLGLMLDEGVSPDAKLNEAGYAMLMVQTADLQRLSDWRAARRGPGKLPAAGPERETPVQVLRTLCYQETLSGAVLGELSVAVSDPGPIGLMVSYFEQPAEAQGIALPDTLTLSYPSDGAVTTAKSIVLLGLSDPTLPLSVSADAVPVRSAGGAFAVEVPLEVGENELTLSQPGGESLSVTVLCREPAPSSGWSGPTPDTQLDETLAGRYVEVTAQLASTLTDPGNDGAIAMTVRQGARARVLGTVETVRGGSVVPAYLLASGDYLLCSNARLLEEESFATLAAPVVTEEESGAQSFSFAGGTPLYYDRLSEGQLVLELYDTTLDFDPALLESRFVAAAEAEPLEEGLTGTRLTLTLSEENPLWGYDVSYAEGQTLLYLRGAPVASRERGRPLTGVTVLLDPGHGGTDVGALGIGGGAGIAEKTINLTLALAVRDRLEQLGATVQMTRSTDETLTLQQRWEAAQQLRPDFFLSLHHNSTALVKNTTGAQGVEAYYFEPGSEKLAASLLSSVSGATGRAEDDPSWNYFYVTRMTCAPAVLFEFGYLVNPEEFESCIDSEAIRATADGVAEGLLRCLADS